MNQCYDLQCQTFFIKLDSVVLKSDSLHKVRLHFHELQHCGLFSTLSVPGQYDTYTVSDFEITKSDIVTISQT